MSGSRAAQRSKRPKPSPQKTGAGASAQTNWVKYATILVAAVCLVGMFSTELADTDFWWHLKTGQFIIERHSLPVPDPFAYTTALHPPSYPGEEQVRHFNLTHEWLSQALMYLVYLASGFTGIILVRACLLAATCGLAGLLAARLAANFYAGLAAAFAASSIAIEFTADRPAAVTFVFVALFMLLLELRRGLWILPALALVWSNCHGGFFLGWIVLAAYCLTRDRRIWIVSAVSILVSGLNPNRFEVLATLLKYRRSEMTANLIEWHRPYLWGPPYQFDILLYACIVVLALSWRRVRLPHWILFAAFAGAALMAFRNIILIGILAPVLIAAYFPYRFRIPPFTQWAAPVLILAAILAGSAQGSFFQLRTANWTIPAGAADYLLANHITAPMFNTYEQGGYLIWRTWPQEKVFIDGRALSESLNRDYRRILYNLGSPVDQVTGPRAALLNRYGIQVVVTNTIEYISGAIYPLALALANPLSSEWQLVHDDPQALVFLRNPPPGTPVISNKLGQVLSHMDTECAADIEHSPDTPTCARTLADYWLRNRVPDRARNMLRLYLSHSPQRDIQAERAWQQLGGGPLPSH